MTTLYQMRYHGVAGEGHGAIVLEDGKILGVDFLGGRYVGSYAIQGGQLVGQAVLALPVDGYLVTGQAMKAGQQVAINLNVPSDLGGGQNVSVVVGGQPVQVAFIKVGDI